MSDKLRKKCTFIHSAALKDKYPRHALFVDGKVVPYTEVLAPQYVDYFLYENSYPSIFEFNEREFDFVFKEKNPAILLTGRNAELEAQFRALAAEQSVLKFAVVHEPQPHLHELDLEFPGLYLYDTRVGYGLA